MQLFDVLRADDAASPVIGIVLMVAVTVVLSAAIGTFALGLESEADQSAPSAQFEFDHDDPELAVVHDGGEPVEGRSLRVVSGSTTVDWDDDTVRHGDSLTLDRSDGDFSRGGTVRVVWVTEGTSSTLETYEVPA